MATKQHFKKLIDEDTEVQDAQQPESPTIDTPIPSAATELFAVDIGYGYTKYKSKYIEGTIPSFVVSAINANPSAVPVLPGDVPPEQSLVIEHNGSLYYVGDNAKSNDPKVQRRTMEERYIDTYYSVLYKAALALAFDGMGAVSACVITGLPNSMKDKLTEQLKTLLGGITSVKYFVGGRSKVLAVNPLSVYVTAQPEGFFIDTMIGDDLQKTDQWDGSKEFGVIDLGHYTMDYIYFKGRHAIGMGQQFSNSDKGMYIIYDSIKSALETKFPGYNPTHTNVEDALKTNHVRISGDLYDVTDIITPIIQRFAEHCFQTIYTQWQDVLNTLSVIYIEGGGAQVVAKGIAQAFKNNARYTKVLASESPQLSNVRGYFKLGRILYKDVL